MCSNFCKNNYNQKYYTQRYYSEKKSEYRPPRQIKERIHDTDLPYKICLSSVRQTTWGNASLTKRTDVPKRKKIKKFNTLNHQTQIRQNILKITRKPLGSIRVLTTKGHPPFIKYKLGLRKHQSWQYAYHACIRTRVQIPRTQIRQHNGASISPAGSEMSVRQRQEDFWSAMVSQPR